MFGDSSVAGALLLETPSRPWRYVTEKLPEPGQKVFLWENDGSPYSPSWRRGTYRPDVSAREPFELRDQPRRCSAYAWQPEPETPPLPGGPDA
jgi:hypothetical protein